ncbi:MAG: DUF4358 domain-containing protein [Solobacterium sp.]|nr:DUF4358 domain-containing protein [Solobacterium sp.]
MLKKFVSSIAALALLAGCGASGGGSKAAAADQAQTIIKDLGMAEKLEQVDERVIQGLFFFDEGMVEDASFYIANDKSADAVGVFKTENPDAVAEYVNDYLKATKEQMKNYYPDEVFKVDNAVVESDSGRVVLIISEDIESAKSEAKKILGK